MMEIRFMKNRISQIKRNIDPTAMTTAVRPTTAICHSSYRISNLIFSQHALSDGDIKTGIEHFANVFEVNKGFGVRFHHVNLSSPTYILYNDWVPMSTIKAIINSGYTTRG